MMIMMQQQQGHNGVYKARGNIVGHQVLNGIIWRVWFSGCFGR